MFRRQDMDFVIFANLHDVTPLSIGLRITGGKMDKTIPRNKKIPCEIVRGYQTCHDNQTRVEIMIFEGEDELVQSSKVTSFWDYAYCQA